MMPELRPVFNGLNVTLDAQLVADVKSIASMVKSAAPVTAGEVANSGYRAGTVSFLR